MNTLVNQQAFALSTMADAKEWSDLASQTDYVPQKMRARPIDVFMTIQYGAELGIGPMAACQGIAIINGKPSIYGDLGVALCRKHPSWRGFKETVIGTGDQMEAMCTVKRQIHGDELEVVEETFSVADAKRANLWGKKGPWSDYPKRMLAMRARGFALRNLYADVLAGLITQDEAQDYPEPMKDVTPHSQNIETTVPQPSAAETVEVPQDVKVDQSDLDKITEALNEVQNEFPDAVVSDVNLNDGKSFDDLLDDWQDIEGLVLSNHNKDERTEVMKHWFDEASTVWAAAKTAEDYRKVHARWTSDIDAVSHQSAWARKCIEKANANIAHHRIRLDELVDVQPPKKLNDDIIPTTSPERYNQGVTL